MAVRTLKPRLETAVLRSGRHAAGFMLLIGRVDVFQPDLVPTADPD